MQRASFISHWQQHPYWFAKSISTKQPHIMINLPHRVIHPLTSTLGSGHALEPLLDPGRGSKRLSSWQVFAMSTESMSHVLRSTERNAAACCMQSTSSCTPSLRMCLSVAILTSRSETAASRVQRLRLQAAWRRNSRTSLKSRTYRWKYHALRQQETLSRGKSLLSA